MQEIEHVATGGIATRRGESGDIRIGTGERGCAQVKARRKALDHATHDSLHVTGLDLALDRHRELAEWPLGGEHVGDVAEGILVLVEPAIRGDVDAPARYVLAIVVARRQPQHLDHARGGRLVAVARQMRDADTHERRRTTCGAEHTGSRARGRVRVRLRFGRAPACIAAYIRYCSVMAAPRRLLLSMNSLMNSCIPCWKISSMRLFSSRARTARAWRWAGPWRP